MKLLQSILDFVSHVCDFFDKDRSPNIKRNLCIVLRPDGTWVLTDKTSLIKPAATNEVPPQQPYYPPRPRYLWETEDKSGELRGPPDFFPSGNELKTKIEQCMDKDVILSCTHSLTDDGTYQLRVELPCCSDDYSKSYTQLKLFVTAMEQTYGLKTIQQDRITSKTSSNKIHVVTFQYDPRSKMF